MDKTMAVEEKAQRFSASLYPKHEALLWALRTNRGNGFSIPSMSEVVQEAIEELARRDLPPEQFAELTNAGSDVIALAS
jgi:hypothetical protein